jgi:hypothetical protein
MACPPDFEPDLNNSCRIKCPRGFKYLQASGGETDGCIYEINNAYRVDLQAIPPDASGPAFTEERNRFYVQLQEVQSKILEDIESRKGLSQVQNQLAGYDAQYKAFQMNYAGYNSMQKNMDLISQTIQDLKPMRPETSPSSDIELEHRRILGITNKQVRMAQVGLFTVLICLVVYLIIPVPYSHGVAFLIACVGIAVGIFLMMTNK